MHTRTRWKSIPYSVVKEHPFSLYGDMIWYFHIQLFQWSWLKRLTRVLLYFCHISGPSVSFSNKLIHIFCQGAFVVLCSMFIIQLFRVTVNIVTRLRTGRSGFESRKGQEVFLLSKMSWPALGHTKPPIQCVSQFFPGVKWVGHKGNHLLPSSAKVKNEWRCTSKKQKVKQSLLQAYVV